MRRLLTKKEIQELTSIKRDANGNIIINEALEVDNNGDITIGRDAYVEDEIIINDSNKIVDVDGYPLINAPKLCGTEQSANNKFTFTQETEFINGLYLLAYGFTNTLLFIYNNSVNQVYKTSGMVIYDNQGANISTMINYKLSNNKKTLEVYSGNNDKQLINGLTGFLFVIKLN